LNSKSTIVCNAGPLMATKKDTCVEVSCKTTLEARRVNNLSGFLMSWIQNISLKAA